MRKKKYEIDASLFTSRKEAHEIMKKVFKKYEYYGNNLDALHDVLTSIMRDSIIIVSGLEASKDNIGTYADTLKKVFIDSAKDNTHLEIVFREPEKAE